MRIDSGLKYLKKVYYDATFMIFGRDNSDRVRLLAEDSDIWDLDDLPGDVSSYGSFKKDIEDEEESTTDEDLESGKFIKAAEKDAWATSAAPILFVCLMSLSSSVSAINSQLASLQSNIFQFNIFKSIVVALTVLVVIACNKDSIKIQRAQWRTLIYSALVNATFGYSYYLAAAFMPVGNATGCYNGLVLLTATVYDIWNKNISKVSVFSAALAITGMFPLTQPWRSTEDINVPMSPCEYLDMCHSHPNQINGSYFDQAEAPDDTSTASSSSWFSGHASTILGFAFLLSGAFTATVRGVWIKTLLKDHPVPPVLFWTSCIEIFVALIVNIVWTRIAHEPLVSMPTSGVYCILSVCLYIIFSSTAIIFCFYAYNSAPISAVAIIGTGSTIALYISQRTFLKGFYPGNANIVEVIGMSMILSGVLLVPCFALSKKLINSNSKAGK